MSSTSKIISAILAAAIIIAVAIIWTSRDQQTQLANTNTGITNQDTLPLPPTATPTPAQTGNEMSNEAQQPVLPPPPAPAKTFEEALPTGSWVLTKATLNGNPVNLNVNVPQPLTLQFNTKTKSVTGFAGCNSFSGKYTAGANSAFSFGELAMTKMACAALSLETSITGAMNQVTTYTLAGSQLVLSNTNGTTQITYDQAK